MSKAYDNAPIIVTPEAIARLDDMYCEQPPTLAVRLTYAPG